MITNADLLELYRRMLVIRGFEERVAVLYRDGEVPGFVHLSIGQEGAAVGACWPLGANDVITSPRSTVTVKYPDSCTSRSVRKRPRSVRAGRSVPPTS